MKNLTETAHRLSSHRRVLMLRRAIGRGFEVLRYALVRPSSSRDFLIVSAQRNMGKAALACLDSVHEQRYPKEHVRHVFIDDASSDDTPYAIQAWLDDHPGHRVEFIRNASSRGMLANNQFGFARGEGDEIGIELNGDDWLSDPGVLAFLNKVYSAEDVWMTYNTHRRTDGSIPLPLPPKKTVVENRSYRRTPWVTSALHTFRLALFRHIESGSLIDPDTGNPWGFSQDQAVYLPMLEMSGSHARHLYRISYIYNFHQQSDENRDRPAQLEATRRIRSLPPYRALDALT